MKVMIMKHTKIPTLHEYNFYNSHILLPLQTSFLCIFAVQDKGLPILSLSNMLAFVSIIINVMIHNKRHRTPMHPVFSLSHSISVENGTTTVFSLSAQSDTDLITVTHNRTS